MLEQGNTVGEKYIVERLIGRGGMSAVYLARDVAGNRYAIKDVERNGQDRNKNVYTQSLTAEGNMLKRLSNPHLPRIYDIIEDADSFMLVMDYVEGSSLDKILDQTGAQKLEDIYAWCIQICEVLEYLHSQPQPVVYRDMKPANVILQENGNIMLIDFGTARTQKLDKVMSQDTVCIGTEGFAAPEQYGGTGQSDARTDIYCMGATIYNLVTGHSPYNPPRGILPLEMFYPELVDTPIDLIIKKCTRKDPAERYQTARELKEALQAAQSGNFFAKGKTGVLNGWVEIKPKGVNGNTGGLSGLLNLGKNRSKQTDVLIPAATEREQVQTGEQLHEQVASIWRSLMVVFVIASVLFLAFSILFAVVRSTVATVVFLMLTLVMIILTVFSIVRSMKD